LRFVVGALRCAWLSIKQLFGGSGVGMKHTRPEALLSRELLCFVRDHAPTVEEFVARYGGAGRQCFHILRKQGVVEVDGGRVRLSRRRLSPDGQAFAWGALIFHLDRDEVDHVCYGPGGPPESPWDAAEPRVAPDRGSPR
jgi:hypothetical protein